jgi:hypothetical protein
MPIKGGTNGLGTIGRGWGLARLWLDQQRHEGDKQRATEEHGPVPDVKALGHHACELHERPPLRIASSLRTGSAGSALLLFPA